MTPGGEIAFTLSTEEAQALKDKLEELRAQDPCSRIFDAILKKIRLPRKRWFDAGVFGNRLNLLLLRESAGPQGAHPRA